MLNSSSGDQYPLTEPGFVRDVCVIAHVDHGKTSLCDHLIASNGYLSKRAAGQARYLDSREDEQTRFITIQSSAIPLLYAGKFLINLVDSPGHVDFSVEVSAAARLCDGALLVIDVMEGFQSQTKTVMRQAWKEGLTLIVVLSKMDRLVLEARLSPSEMYTNIQETLENVNIFLHQCIADQLDTNDVDAIDHIYAQHAFSPEKGNVIFASAVHGWAFTVRDFAKLLVNKLAAKGICKLSHLENLVKIFWGDYCLDLKTGRARPAQKEGKQNVAATFVFQPLCEIYGIGGEVRMESVRKCLTNLEVADISEDMLYRLKAQGTAALPGYILSQWASCAGTCMQAIVDLVPDPIRSFARRQELFGGLNCFSALSEAKLVYIAKSMSADLQLLRLTGDKLHGRENLTDFVGFGRVFSGIIKEGERLYINDGQSDKTKSIIIQHLFLPIGIDLHPVKVAGAGCIVALSFTSQDGANLFDKSVQSTIDWLLTIRSSAKQPLSSSTPHPPSSGFNPVDRCVTLSDCPDVQPLVSVYQRNTPGTLRIGVSPKNLSDWPAFLRGLALLYRSDPAIHMEVLDSGEFVICCQGQVHLERVRQDFANLYCQNIDLSISPPLVALRETIVEEGRRAAVNPNVQIPFPPWNIGGTKSREEEVGLVTSGGLSVCVRAHPMPAEALDWMDKHLDPLFAIFHANVLTGGVVDTFGSSTISECQDLARQRFDHFVRTKETFSTTSRALALSVAGDSRTALYVNEVCAYVTDLCASSASVNGIISGFQSASRSGPICEEAIRGVIFELQYVKSNVAPASSEGAPTSNAEEITTGEGGSSLDAGSSTAFVTGIGPLLGCVRQACRFSMEIRGAPRIYELMLRIEISCEESSVGKVHSLLAQRRAIVISETVDDRTFEFLLVAKMPASETFDFALELRRKSSGKASANLSVDGWALNTTDPFPEATANCLAEDAEEICQSNVARSLVMAVRKRKGLPTGEKIIREGANKQRTLGRSK